MRYIALLRAINVGGNRIVKMEALRQMLTDFGAENVKTYIQSGNALFDLPESPSADLARRLEAHLHQATGFEIPTALRTPAQLEALTARLPVRAAEQRLNVYFFGGEVHPEADERLRVLQQEGLDLWLEPDALILRTPKTLKDKRLDSPNWLEKQLGTWTTARNDNTVKKLRDMALS